MFDTTMRVQGNTLEAPVYELEHPDTGSNISLVGMIHVANQTYYDDIAELVETTEEQGAVVHYEFIKPGSPEEAAQYPDLADKVQSLSGLQAMAQLLMFHVPNTVSQKEALVYQSHWENHDFSTTELVRRLGPEGLVKFMKFTEQLDKMKGYEESEMVGTVIRGALRLLPIMERLSLFKSRSHVRRVVVDERNAIAVGAVQETLGQNPGQNITMLWGSAHAPGITHGLKELGYKPVNRHWLNAITITKRSQVPVADTLR